MKGKIYKIEHKNSSFDEIYIGETFQEITERWRTHYNQFNLDEEYNKCSINYYFKKYGRDNFQVSLIKEYDVFDSKHLRAYEQLWFNKLRKKIINEVNGFQIFKIPRKDIFEKHLLEYPEHYDYYLMIVQKLEDHHKETYKKLLERHPDENKKDYQKNMKY